MVYLKSGDSKVPDGMEQIEIKPPKVAVAESELGMALEGDALAVKEKV